MLHQYDGNMTPRGLVGFGSAGDQALTLVVVGRLASEVHVSGTEPDKANDAGRNQ